MEKVPSFLDTSRFVALDSNLQIFTSQAADLVHKAQVEAASQYSQAHATHLILQEQLANQPAYRQQIIEARRTIPAQMEDALGRFGGLWLKLSPLRIGFAELWATTHRRLTELQNSLSRKLDEAVKKRDLLEQGIASMPGWLPQFARKWYLRAYLLAH